MTAILEEVALCIKQKKYQQEVIPVLTEQDAMGMTPLHVLSSNPSANLNMIQILISKNQDAVQIRNIHGMTPLHMYLITKGVMSRQDYVEFNRLNNGSGDGHVSKSCSIFSSLKNSVLSLLDDNCRGEVRLKKNITVNEMISMGLKYDIISALLVFSQRCVEKEFNEKEENAMGSSSLYPFMNAAFSDVYGLCDIYDMALKCPAGLLKRNF